MKSVIRRASAGAALVATLALLIASGTTGLADPASPITMTVVGTPSPVVSGGELTWTITMVNTGGSKTTNVVLNDQFNGLGGIGIPPQLQLASTRGSCSQTINGITCQGGTIEGGGSWVVTIRGKVVFPAGATLDNTATVTGTRSAQNFTTTLTSHVLVSGNVSTLPDLTMTKTGPTTVVAGQAMTYTLTVNNQGNANATDIEVVDTLPAGLSGVTAVGTSLFTCDLSGLPTVRCSGGAVNAGSNATITINANAPNTPDATLTNTAVADPNNEITESNELNNTSALVNTLVIASAPPSPLGINITDDPSVITGAGPSDPVVPGGNITFKTKVFNLASTRADDVTIVVGTQSLEAASVVVGNPPIVVNGTIGQGGGCTKSATQARCLVRTLNPGGSIEMTVTGKVIGFAGSSFITTAVVTANIKNVGYSNNDTELTTVKPYVDLTITKKDSPDPVIARSFPGAPAPGGSGLTYLLTVGNSGMTAATDVVVRDPLPAGTIFHAYTAEAGSNFTCSVVPATNVLTCTGGTIPASSTKTIEIVLVAPPYVGSITNTATVDPNNAIFEADDTNNTGSATTVVTTGVDLSVTKTADFPTIATSGTLTYTLVVENNGPLDVTNIRLRDTLPTGSIYRDIVQATNGFTCSHAGGILECVGGAIRGTMSESYAGGAAGPIVPGGPDFATIKFRVFAQSIVGTMHNEVRVDPLNEIPEINEANNIATLDTNVIDNGPGAFIDLEIKKEGTATTTPGGAISYTIKVWNTGTDPAPNVVVRDVLPAGTTFVSAVDGGGPGSPFTCGHAAGVVTCTGATINGATTELTAHLINISVTAPNQNISLTNEAQVDPNNAINEGSEQDNTSTWVTQVQSVINLTISKTGPPTSNQSQPGEYVIKVKNEKKGGGAGQTAFDVVVIDPLPVGLIPLAAEIDPGQENNWACQISQNPINLVSCVGDLNPDQEVTIKIAVFMTAESGKSLDNEACVDPDDLIEEADPGETDNCSTHTTVITATRPNLTLTKSSSPSSVTPGQELIYTLLLVNNGNASAATPLTVTDVLPTDVAFVDVQVAAPWTCSFATGTVSCTDNGTGLAIGASVDITIRTTVNAGVTLPITNTASTTSPAQTTDVGGEPEAADKLGDNTAAVTTTVGGTGFDLVLSNITDNPDPVAPGQGLTYTIVGVNAGTSEAANVKIRIQLPTGGINFTSAVADGTNGFNCGAPDASHVIECVGTLPGGGDTTITVRVVVLVAPPPPPDLTLTATIDPPSLLDPDGDFAEANEGNNTKNEVTTVTGDTCIVCADLVATELKALPAVIGSTTTFTAQVVNIGDTGTATNAASDVLVRLQVFSAGTFTLGPLTVSDAAFNPPQCETTTVPLLGPFTSVTINCKGNLGPSQGLTITQQLNSVTGDLLAILTADPNNVVNTTSTPPEFSETNNQLFLSVLKLF